MNLPDIRIGAGFDAHRLAPNRALILGGVRVDYPLGLVGHSDADVLLHAVADACLGAACLGDLGAIFPSSDVQYRDADSRDLLREVCRLAQQNGWHAVNVDSTVIAEQPKLAAYLPQMRANIAADLAVDESRVSVKVTTTDQLGFCGRGEGIGAQAVVLLAK